MMFIRLLRMIVHLLMGLAICSLVFPWVDVAARQARIRRWSAKLLMICGVRVLTRGAPSIPLRPAMIVSNHISWLDIFVINTQQPCRFVAKADVRKWPLIGWLCAKTGTIFITRGKRSEVPRIFQSMADGIAAGDHIAFFPEGTTAAQGSLLPFHSNLFEAVIDTGVPVQPYAIRYVDAQNRLHPAANYIGDTTIVQSIIMILKAGSMTAELITLPMIATAGQRRRDLAVAAHRAIAAGLGYEQES